MQHRISSLFLATLLALLPVGHAQSKAAADALNFPQTSLQGHGASRAGVTLSGLSAGAFFAVQFHMAYSEIVDGSASIAGGAYWCSKGSANIAVDRCMKGEVASEVSLERYYKEVNAGRVAGDEHLSGDRAFIFSGENDILVARETSQELEHFMKSLLGEAQVEAVYDSPAGHGLPTLNYGGPCQAREYFNSPWLLDCGFDGAGMMLTSLMPDLEKPKKGSGGKLYIFDQRPFINSLMSSMANFGHVFIPDSCKAGGCRIHVALHGCDQDPLTVGQAFVARGGYNDWALANELIILYPAAKKSYFVPQNPLGCFDWWGYTGSDFHTRGGTQMKAIYSMLVALSRLP